MELADIKQVYFLGIGGIGMSALARYFHGRGVKVDGYDLVQTELTDQLSAEGMTIHYEEDVAQIPEAVDLVIWTPAIPATHLELIWVKEKGLPLMKRAEVLGLLSKSHDTIAVAGTHGKTTTSAILAHILNSNEKSVTAFLGGILAKENSNFIRGDSNLMVVEADEYDRSFLHLHPKMLIIISTDHDHIDIYENEAALYDAYGQLLSQVADGGIVILGHQVIRNIKVEWMQALAERKVKVLRICREFDFDSIKIVEGQYQFDYIKGTKKEKYKSNLPGLHNVMNTSLAIAICKELGLKKSGIATALDAFEGVKRRFHFLHNEERILIDDYAHLPEEVRYAVQTVKDLYPTDKVLGIFQPHLYSRTLEFYKGFARELSGLDGVILLPVYPARELPVEGVESELIYNLISLDEKYLIPPEELLVTIKEKMEYKVIMTIGAADLDKYHKEIIDIIKY